MEKSYNEIISIYNNRTNYESDNKFIWNRYFLDNYSLNRRVDFVSELIKDSVRNGFLVEVKFWDSTEKVLDFFKNLKNKSYVLKEYKDGQEPGIIIVEDKELDIEFFSDLLQRHYNYEHAEDPSLNIQILLFIERGTDLIVYDFYDDRGFIVNYYM